MNVVACCNINIVSWETKKERLSYSKKMYTEESEWGTSLFRQLRFYLGKKFTPEQCGGRGADAPQLPSVYGPEK